jgi:hypothetical protein
MCSENSIFLVKKVQCVQYVQNVTTKLIEHIEPIEQIFFYFTFYFLLFTFHFIISPHFIPIFLCNEQHTKALSIFFAQMFVVHFMRPTDGAYVGVIAAGKPFESLVDDDLMHNKIAESV